MIDVFCVDLRRLVGWVCGGCVARRAGNDGYNQGVSACLQGDVLYDVVSCDSDATMCVYERVCVVCVVHDVRICVDVPNDGAV
jgi:hypothetical protein